MKFVFWSLFDSEHLIQLATFPKTSYKLLCNLNLFSIYCEIFGLEKLHQLSGEVGFWKILNIKSNFKRVNNKIDWNMYIWRRNKLNPEKKMYWWKLLIELHSHWNSLAFVQKPTNAADSIIATVSLIPSGGDISQFLQLTWKSLRSVGWGTWLGRYQSQQPADNNVRSDFDFLKNLCPACLHLSFCLQTPEQNRMKEKIDFIESKMF